MILINNPFDEIAFSKETTIMLDACILLGILNNEDRMFGICDKTMDDLSKNDVKFFVSNVVLSEVINKTVNNLFLTDLQFNFHNKIILNTNENIDIIFNQLNSNDANILLNSNSNIVQLKSIKYTKYFNKINKNRDYKIRNSLNIYFQKANELCSSIENKYDFRFLTINEDIMSYARKLSVKYMLGINDAQHLATAKAHKMEYLLSTDGDFGFVKEELKVKYLKLINKIR